jgi:hypothetical protein
MALGELGQEFKRFARQKILDCVRIDGPQLDKDATYRTIRQSFACSADAAAALDTGSCPIAWCRSAMILGGLGHRVRRARPRA